MPLYLEWAPEGIFKTAPPPGGISARLKDSAGTELATTVHGGPDGDDSARAVKRAAVEEELIGARSEGAEGEDVEDEDGQVREGACCCWALLEGTCMGGREDL